MSSSSPDSSLSSNVAVGPAGATRSVPESVARRVWIAAGGRCTICKRFLLSDEHTGEHVSVGQLAHIVGWTDSAGSPRGSGADLTLDDRNGAHNLLLLCHDQHKVIDDKSLWDRYDVGLLRTMKRTHETRIKQLTGMQDDDRTTVLRMVGQLHGAGVELSEQTVMTSILANGRFPDYVLVGLDEYEVDLRGLPGEVDGSETYWASARSALQDSLRRLAARIGKDQVRHMSVFAIARIPLLVLLGTLLDDTVPTTLYPKRRGGDEGWGWPSGTADTDFTHARLRAGPDPRRVAVLFSISGSVDPARLPAEIHDHDVFEIRPNGTTPAPDVVGNPATLDQFSVRWRALLAELELTHPGLESIDVFAAVPTTVAVAIGRAVMRAGHPPLRLYDRATASGSYQFALEVNR